MAKFLVLTRYKSTKEDNPHDPHRLDDPVGAFSQARSWGQQKKQQGLIDQAYAVPNNKDGVVGVAIVNANSRQEVEQQNQTHPLRKSVDFEVHELVDYETMMQQIEQEIPQRFEVSGPNKGKLKP